MLECRVIFAQLVSFREQDGVEMIWRLPHSMRNLEVVSTSAAIRPHILDSANQTPLQEVVGHSDQVLVRIRDFNDGTTEGAVGFGHGQVHERWIL